MWYPVVLLCAAAPAFAQSGSSAPAKGPAPAPSTIVSPAIVTAAIRERTNTNQWFAATPNPEVYAYQDSLLRLSVAQRVRHFDYLFDLGQSAEISLPNDAVSAVAAQGQLGLGGSYYAANTSNMNPAAGSVSAGVRALPLQAGCDRAAAGAVRVFRGAGDCAEEPNADLAAGEPGLRSGW